jgi:hypothetical protein
MAHVTKRQHHKARTNPTAWQAIDPIDGATRRDPAQPTTNRSVYFLLDHHDARIKIGVSSNPQRRKRDIEHQRGHELDLLGTINADRDTEHILHRRFAPYRVEAREWFSTEIIPHIAEILTS